MRLLNFFDGFTSATEPSAGVIGASQLQSYVDDAAFVTAKGSAAANGDMYYNTTANLVKVYQNGGWKSLPASAATAILTSSRLLVTDSNGLIAVLSVSSTEAGYLAGVTSAIQTQLDAKVAKADYTGKGVILVGTGAGTYVALTAPATGQVLTGDTAQASGLKWAAPGGGGGGSLRWYEQGPAPELVEEYGVQSRGFIAGDSQSLYTAVKVPNSYQAGNPVTLRMPFYSGGNAGTALLRTQTTLIRSGTDAMSSTTNQRTSTNSAPTLAAGTVNEPQATNFDLTSSTGEVNSVAIAAGDLLLVRLYRDTDTATAELKALTDAAEVSFT